MHSAHAVVRQRRVVFQVGTHSSAAAARVNAAAVVAAAELAKLSRARTHEPAEAESDREISAYGALARSRLCHREKCAYIRKIYIPMYISYFEVFINAAFRNIFHE